MDVLWNKLQMGLRRYCAENGFGKVVLGLSGGLDSALTAVLAADALGAVNVQAIMMKTRHTSDLSLQIARKIAELNGIEYQELDIEPLVAEMSAFLQGAWGGDIKTVVNENIQARIRGQILMAYSNQNGALVLACGNKSEALTGYCTLYGDTCGGLMPIGNLYKTTVFDLAKWRNQKSEVLPEEVIIRAPSAELSEGQKDEDSLPPYAVLDAILRQLVDEGKNPEEVCVVGAGEETVSFVQTLVRKSAFKRVQMANALDV